MDKEKIIELLNKTHEPAIPNWTSAETQAAYEALQILAFMWYRSDELIGKRV